MWQVEYTELSSYKNFSFFLSFFFYLSHSRYSPVLLMVYLSNCQIAISRYTSFFFSCAPLFLQGCRYLSILRYLLSISIRHWIVSLLDCVVAPSASSVFYDIYICPIIFLKADRSGKILTLVLLGGQAFRHIRCLSWKRRGKAFWRNKKARWKVVCSIIH